MTFGMFVPLYYFFLIYSTITVLPVSEGAAEGASIFYKEHMLRTDQLCPDLQESVNGRDIDTANYPYKSVFHLVDNAPVASFHDFPCIFESKGPKKQHTTKVVIKAIYADKNQWNFTNSETCSEHIKLKFQEPSDERYGLPKIVCKIPKTTATDIIGPLYHPMVWRHPKGKMGLSFSTFDLEHNVLNLGGDGNWDFSEGNIISESKPRFVQIVFSVYFEKVCSLRVQQYYIDIQRDYCNGTNPRFYQLCGAYDCSEERAILSQIGFWSQKAKMEQIEKMLKLVKLRRDEPTYSQFLISTLRAMIMPILFLVVFYVTRRLRIQKAASESRRGSIAHSRRRRNNSSNNPNSNNPGQPNNSPETSNLAHAIYDIPITTASNSMASYKYEDDLPPPTYSEVYESLVPPPPTYSEATALPSTSSCLRVTSAITAENMTTDSIDYIDKTDITDTVPTYELSTIPLETDENLEQEGENHCQNIQTTST